MVAELQERFECSPRLIEGGRGIFDVKLDGVLVYSKHQTGHFPKPGEIATLVGSR